MVDFQVRNADQITKICSTTSQIRVSPHTSTFAKNAPLDANYPKFLVKNVNSNKERNDDMTKLKKVT
jgi:hypothetical protein